ncbi:MAG: transporter, hydrophobe/amphiphile efflux family [Firmicutes bacterium]|nr:transporter, hydrophobe/amphiphile efflux family [Bacillota bacterium]
MAKFFINRPIFAIVLSILISLGGLIAVFNLAVAQYPQISPPQVRVSTSYQGANAEVVEKTVAQIIEEQVNGAEGMVSMSSSSSDSGSYMLTVQFETGKDGDMAAVQTQNRIAQATASLPDTVQSTGVTATKSANDMAVMFNFVSPNGTYDASFMKNYASNYLLENLKRVKGVGNVMEFGADYAMRIWLNPEKMAQLGVTTSDVSSAITAQNQQAPAGGIGKAPGLPNQEYQYTATIQGRLENSNQFGNIIVKTNTDGSFIRLKDVARVELGDKSYSFSGEANGKPQAGFAIQLSSDANALETVSNVRKVIAEAEKKFPPDLECNVAVDNTRFVRESLYEVCKTLVEALVLVIIVVFIFLQSGRATLIPMLAVPVSLLGTFASFLVLGFTINTLTLFAMVLAIGLVVDDAIVVIEAVEHHMRYNGLSPVDATKRAMSEVSGPVVAIAFVLASVFIPVAFFGGTMGVLYRQFALTIAVSMGISAVVALSLTPALCALLLKPYNPDAYQGFVGKMFDKFNTWFERTIERYGGGLKRLIRKAPMVIAMLVVVIILAGVLYKNVPSSFVPAEDQGFVITAVNLPEGSSMNRTKAVVNKLAADIRTQPGVETTMAITGFDLMGMGEKQSAGASFVGLKPWDERKDPRQAADMQALTILMKGAKLPEASVFAFQPPALPGLGMVGGFSMMLENRGGLSMEEMEKVSSAFVAAAQKRPEIGMIRSGFQSNTPGYKFTLDREKAEKLGVSVSDVFSTIQAFLGGSQVNDFNLFGKTYKVIMQAEPGARSDIDAIRLLFVKSSSGGMVPLSSILTAQPTNAPSTIARYNGSQSIQINGSPANGYSSGQAMTALEEVAAQTLPSGFSYEWSGQSREEKISSGQAPILFGLALVFVFLCLAALYESWTVPFAVLLAVPTGFFGAFLFQQVRGLENSIYMQIGLIMLIGLAAKNAILIVEFAKIRVDKGMDPLNAAIEAAKIRLRPILMTSLAFIIGCIPLALASGAGAAARKSMGNAVVGGMFMATTLGIFLIPVLFVVIEKASDKFHVWLRKGKDKTPQFPA